MSDVMQTLVIQTDEAGASSLKDAAKNVNDIQFETSRIHAQVGDPDTWMFVAQLAAPAISALGTAIILLIKQRKIKYIKIGKLEFHDITVEQLQRIMEMVDK